VGYFSRGDPSLEKKEEGREEGKGDVPMEKVSVANKHLINPS